MTKTNNINKCYEKNSASCEGGGLVTCNDDVSKVSVKPYKDGTVCVKCEEFFEFSVPDQDNTPFVCYGCRVFRSHY